MSRQFRYRITAFVLGGLIFGAPLLTNGSASAEQLSPSNEGGRQVTFSGGGVLGLSCHSTPDIESMVVPADSTVRLINQTGYSAQLRLGRDTKGTVPDDSATEVVFRRGTTSVLLKPNCPLGDDATPVLVTATPSAPAQMPDPMPAPSGGGASGSAMAAAGTSSPSGTAPGSALPDSASAVARPSRLAPATSQAGVRAPATLRGSAATQAAASAAQGMPQGGGATRVRVKSSGTPDGRVPAYAGMPPGDRKALIPGVRTLDLSQAMQTTSPAAPAAPPAEIAAAEPVASMEPIRASGPIGLLALIAAVCVMGVGAAAIRAIVSQRANRAKVA
ncbi:hypothetical protein [Actinoplanes subtropicus]|uniref:hypothetical protein n=1 Tax=Actinoplanes subtropicus TaxID=543632 RepID=UPI0004C3139B|nr:hypothetical protein [Actinoplanes subtropicus]